MTRFLALFTLVILVGCLADQKGKQNTSPTVNVTVPESKAAPDLNGFRQETDAKIKASAESNQNQLTGALNVAFSRLSDEITGVKATFSTWVNTVTELRVSAENNMKAVARLDTTVTGVAAVAADTQIRVQAIGDVNTRIDKLETKLEANTAAAAAAQVGYQNKFDQKIEDIKATAGRDVLQNFFPKEAADTVIRSAEIMAGIISILCILASTVISLAYKYARQREVLRTQEEREERKQTHEVLLQVIAMLPEGSSADVHKLLATVKKP